MSCDTTIRHYRNICWISVFLIIFFITAAASAQDLGAGLHIVIQKGHTGDVKACDYHPSGKYIATGGNDAVIKIWDVTTGREIRTFTGHLDEVTSVAFSPNGRMIASASRDKTVVVWNVSTGESVRLLKGHQGAVLCLCFSPDGRYLVTGSEDRLAKRWNLSSGTVIETYQGHESYVRSVQFSPDGKWFATGSHDKTAILWETNTGYDWGSKIRAFEGHAGEISSVSFSSDGKYLATGSWDQTAKVWDVQTGENVRTLDEGITVWAVSFSPNGRQLAVGGGYFKNDGSHDGRVRVWDLAANSVKNSLEAHNWTVWSLDFSRDGKRLLTASADKTAMLWDMASDRHIRTFTGDAASITAAGFNPDGLSLCLADDEGFLHFWQIASGRPIRTINAHYTGIPSLRFSPDGRTLLTGGHDDEAKLWKMPSGQLLHVLKGHNSGIASVDFSPDGKKAATSSWSIYSGEPTQVKIWDVQTGREQVSLPEGQVSGMVTRFSPDGQWIAAGCRLYNAVSGQWVRSFEGQSYGSMSVDFSRDGKYFVSGGELSSASLFNANTGREIRYYTLPGESISGRNSISYARFGKDNRTVYLAKEDGQIFLLDVASDQVQHIFKGHTDMITAIDFNPDGRFMLTSSRDGTAKLWDLSFRREVATLVTLGEKGWAATTPEGWFDCSEDAVDKIHFTQGLDVYALDQFFEDFYRPGLLAEVLGVEKVELPAISITDRLKTSPPPDVEIIRPFEGQTFTQKEIQIAVKITDRGGGIDEIMLLHNGKRVSEDTRGVRIVERNDALYKAYTISLLNGENQFMASAFSKGRIESRRNEITVFSHGTAAEVNSYVFVIGIDQYENSVYNLNFAKADASSVKDLIQMKSGGLFQNIIVHELYNTDADGSSIQSTFQTIIQQCRPQDVFTFFYAGHGVMLSDASGKEQFYLIPSEVTNMYDEEKVQSSGISGFTLVDWSRKIPARKQLFIIDACQAGSLSETFTLRGAAEQKALAQLARSAGVHVVASTGSEQFAAEFQELGHGLFTHALIQAIGGAADGTPKDGRVTVREINAYLENVIPELSAKYRGQPQYPVVFSKGQDFPVVVE